MIIGIALACSGIILTTGGIILIAVQVIFLKMDVLGSLSEALPAGAIGLGLVLCMIGLEIFFRARGPLAHHKDNGKEKPLATTNDNRRVEVISKQEPGSAPRLDRTSGGSH